jgi:hypothetical protein
LFGKKISEKQRRNSQLFAVLSLAEPALVRGYPREKAMELADKKRPTHRGVTKSVIKAFKVMAVSTGWTGAFNHHCERPETKIRTKCRR